MTTVPAQGELPPLPAARPSALQDEQERLDKLWAHCYPDESEFRRRVAQSPPAVASEEGRQEASEPVAPADEDTFDAGWEGWTVEPGVERITEGTAMTEQAKLLLDGLETLVYSYGVERYSQGVRIGRESDSPTAQVEQAWAAVVAGLAASVEGLLQDEPGREPKRLSKWFAGRPGAKRQVREVVAELGGTRQPITLSPCPFCGGPPKPAAVNGVGGGAIKRASLESPDGHYVSAHVFCHECGAQGESHRGICCDEADIRDLMDKATASWCARDFRHHELYIANAEDGRAIWSGEIWPRL